MSLDVSIPRNISFVGCILIIAATESYKISRSFFIAQQWRRRCISSSISFNWHLVHIRWFFVVIGLLNRPLSIFRSCELIRYLAIAVMRWFPLICKIYGSTQKYFFTRAFTRALNIFSPLLCKYSNYWFFKWKHEFICIPNILWFPSLIKPGSFEDRANTGTPVREANGI